MTKASSVYELRKAITKASKVYTWTVIGCTQDGTQIGGFVETFKSNMLNVLKQYTLPYSSWDLSVKVFFRLDPETNVLHIEGFLAA